MAEWFLDKITASTGAGTNRWKKVYLEKIPIPMASTEESEMFKLLTQELLSLHDSGISTESQDAKIAQLIFQKYNLSSEEIRILNS